MPAMLDDPKASVIYRTSGSPPYPLPGHPHIPIDIAPRQVTLRDRITIATLIPFFSAERIPSSLLSYLSDQINREILKGDTYPMEEPIPLAAFGPYWFQNFGAVMVLGELETVEELEEMESKGTDWGQVCLGSFYIKPNYPGRSSHVCNGGFLVTDAARNRGVGRLMGEGYLEWAPKLGYTYSVFNLVYETNVASCRIWDALGFKRIGRVKGCGSLRSHPDGYIDAIIYGRDLGPEGEDFVSEERFDKIRFYLKHGKYPNGADRAEKSRLRSAATHYKLLPPEGEEGGEVIPGAGNATVDNERLMLKDKEVVADPQRQYEIARSVHAQSHGGINKTTATIAERFHWVRIKETVSLVIKNCTDCKETGKVPTVRPEAGADSTKSTSKRAAGANGGTGGSAAGGGRGGSLNQDPNSAIERIVHFDSTPTHSPGTRSTRSRKGGVSPHQQTAHDQQHAMAMHSRAPMAHMQSSTGGYGDMPLDPQIMESHGHGHGHGHPSQRQQHPSLYHPQSQQQQQQDHHQIITDHADEFGIEMGNHQPVPIDARHALAGYHNQILGDDGVADAHGDTDISMTQDGPAQDESLKHHLLVAGYGSATGDGMGENVNGAPAYQ